MQYAVHESAFDAVDGSSTGTEVPSGLGAVKAPRFGEGAKMQTITTVGLDIASLRRSGAMVLNICSISVLIAVTNGYPTSHVHALPLWAPSCGC